MVQLCEKVLRSRLIFVSVILDRWGDPGVDGRIILGWTFRRWD